MSIADRAEPAWVSEMKRDLVLHLSIVFMLLELETFALVPGHDNSEGAKRISRRSVGGASQNVTTIIPTQASTHITGKEVFAIAIFCK